MTAPSTRPSSSAGGRERHAAGPGVSSFPVGTLSSDAVRSLVESIEHKDLSTAAHTWRVVLYTRALAEEFGVDAQMMDRLTTAAALHDIGKLDIPDAILQKPGALTDEEFATIKTHTIRGHERLLALGEHDNIILELIRHHHERWDGKGYPDALAGEQIAASARYFAVIDSFDAMTSVRPYRATTGLKAARHAMDELEAGAGTRYWPPAVEAFGRLFSTGALTWISEYYNDSCGIGYDHGRPASKPSGGPRPA